jgi:hypothetical protein
MAEQERIYDFRPPAINKEEGIASGNVLKSIFDYYFHTDPATGYFVPNVSFLYPNNVTPKKLEPLFNWLIYVNRLLDAVAGGTLTLGGSATHIFQGYTANEQDRLRRELWQWKERFEFYRDILLELLGTQEQARVEGEPVPEIMLGAPNELSARLGQLVIEPLFLGWYPNDPQVWYPFSEMGRPYSFQTVQAPPDLNTPFSLINQLEVAEAAYEASEEMFWPDVATAIKETVDEATEGMGPAIATLVIGAAFIYGFTMSTKGPGRTKV